MDVSDSDSEEDGQVGQHSTDIQTDLPIMVRLFMLEVLLPLVKDKNPTKCFTNYDSIYDPTFLLFYGSRFCHDMANWSPGDYDNIKLHNDFVKEMER